MISTALTARSAVVLGALLVAAISRPGLADAQSLCDPNGDGVVNDADAVQVLRAAAQLSSSCSMTSATSTGTARSRTSTV